MGINISLQLTHFIELYMLKSGVSGSQGSSVFNCLSNCHNFPKGCIITFPSNEYKCFLFSISFPIFIFHLIDSSHWNKCRLYLIVVVLIYISLMISENWNIFSSISWPFVCLLLRYVYFNNLCFNCAVFLLLTFYIFWILTHYHIFFQTCRISLCNIRILFAIQKVLSLM